MFQNPTLTDKQASTLLDAISIAIQSKPINSDKQRKQLLNLIQSFKKRYEHMTVLIGDNSLFS